VLSDTLALAVSLCRYNMALHEPGQSDAPSLERSPRYVSWVTAGRLKGALPNTMHWACPHVWWPSRSEWCVNGLFWRTHSVLALSVGSEYNMASSATASVLSPKVSQLGHVFMLTEPRNTETTRALPGKVNARKKRYYTWTSKPNKPMHRS
jgi:hypothetical protein